MVLYVLLIFFTKLAFHVTFYSEVMVDYIFCLFLSITWSCDLEL